jgi:transcriptional regulator with PAS, ATPase and Fis domain
LQDSKYKRIGNPRSHKANIRIIAAANGNLRRLVKEGNLYYKMNVVSLYIPPLRKKREDILIPVGRR